MSMDFDADDIIQASNARTDRRLSVVQQRSRVRPRRRTNRLLASWVLWKMDAFGVAGMGFVFVRNRNGSSYA